MLAGDVAAPDSTVASALLPAETPPVPKKAKRTLNRHATGTVNPDRPHVNCYVLADSLTTLQFGMPCISSSGDAYVLCVVQRNISYVVMSAVCQCRVPKGNITLMGDAQSDGAPAPSGGQAVTVASDADSDEEQWHDSDGEEQELAVDSSVSPLGASHCRV